MAMVCGVSPCPSLMRSHISFRYTWRSSGAEMPKRTRLPAILRTVIDVPQSGMTISSPVFRPRTNMARLLFLQSPPISRSTSREVHYCCLDASARQLVVHILHSRCRPRDGPTTASLSQCLLSSLARRSRCKSDANGTQADSAGAPARASALPGAADNPGSSA
jgi:hypothetical protein